MPLAIVEQDFRRHRLRVTEVEVERAVAVHVGHGEAMVVRPDSGEGHERGARRGGKPAAPVAQQDKNVVAVVAAGGEVEARVGVEVTDDDQVRGHGQVDRLPGRDVETAVTVAQQDAERAVAGVGRDHVRRPVPVDVRDRDVSRPGPDHERRARGRAEQDLQARLGARPARGGSEARHYAREVAERSVERHGSSLVPIRILFHSGNLRGASGVRPSDLSGGVHEARSAGGVPDGPGELSRET